MKDVKQPLLQVPERDGKHGALDVGLRPLWIHLTLAAFVIDRPSHMAERKSPAGWRLGSPRSINGVTPENCRPRIWV